VSGKYESFAQQYLDVVHSSEGSPEVMCRCVLDEHSSPAFQFNLDSGLFYCFRCDEGGSITSLMRHLGVSYRTPAPDVRDVTKKLESLRRGGQSKRSQPDPLPESWLRRFDFPTAYWQQRGFSPATIDAFDLGYDPMENAVAIPIRNINGELLGAIRRYLDEDVELRYRYPLKFSRSKNLFGSWLADADDSHSVVLCEGAIDAMSVWQAGYPAVAQYGSSISPSQIRLLRRMGFGEVVLFYDNDKAGRKATLLAKGRKVRQRKGKRFIQYSAAHDLRRDFLLRRVVYTKGMADDPGAMGTRMIRRAVDGAVAVM
jgi:DNA primase